MRSASQPVPNPDDDLDLPPLDGEGDGGDEAAAGDDDEDFGELADGYDALDDATSDEAALEELPEEVREDASVFADGDDATPVDVGPFDLAISADEKVLEDDEPDARPYEDAALGAVEETMSSDGGEEGPLAEDEELREEDLPALDADEEGDVADAEVLEGALLSEKDELRWDDRAWARVEVPQDACDDADDSGALAVPGDDPAHAARDATWRQLEEAGGVTAALLVPGGGVLLALERPERAVIVRVAPDGGAAIIAEIEPAGDDEDGAGRITGLRWDSARGCVVASGSFGAQAFRPA